MSRVTRTLTESKPKFAHIPPRGPNNVVNVLRKNITGTHSTRSVVVHLCR